MSTFFGLDIGSSQIKVLQAEKTAQGFKVIRVAAVTVDAQRLTASIQLVMKEAGIKSSSEVNLALPEAEVFTRIIDTPRLSETELASSIQYEAEQYIPVALNEVDLFHQILPKSNTADDKLMKVLLIAVPKTKTSEIMDIFDKAELIPRSLETELFSLKRVLGDEKKAQILISFGHKTTDIMILRQGEPSFTYSVNVGGLALTRNLMNELSLSVEQAEEYKKTYGLRQDLLEGKVAKILIPTIDEIISQINKALLFMQQQGLNKNPDELILSGGGALLPALSGYLTEKLNIEVVMADPFRKFVHDENFTKHFPYEANPQWTTVTGLALKGLI